MSKALSWILALVIAAALLYFGTYAMLIAPMMDNTTAVEFFEKAQGVAVHYLGEGVGQYTEPYGRWIIGGVATLAALLAIWPGGRAAGAFLAFVISVVGLAVHVGGEMMEQSDIGLKVAIGGGEPTYYCFAGLVVLLILSIWLMMTPGRD